MTFKEDFKEKIKETIWNLHNARYYWRREGDCVGERVYFDHEIAKYRSWIDEVLKELAEERIKE